MLLFKPEHVPLIVDGIKTQTRRTWSRPRVRVDAIHPCYTRPPWGRSPGQPFARVRILGVRRERLGNISRADARREGYRSQFAYVRAFAEINRVTESAARRMVVYVVDFVRGCRLCGCTDDRACEDGCAWVEPDLCSACWAPPLEARHG